jgi:hypothetical protein
MWHALADPAGTHVFPLHAEELEEDCSRWGPALHLLAYSLGWPRIDLGLQRWWDAGRPTDDPRLEFVERAWGDDTVKLLAWCQTSDHFVTFAQAVATETGTIGGPPAPVGLTDEVRRLAATSTTPEGLGPGGDALHLSIHGLSPVESTPRGVRVDRGGAPHATLLIDDYRGWYRTLHRIGPDVPALPGDRSRRVDVVCRPIGWLGTYRRSRTSGRWFAGPYRHHAMGC